MVIVGTQSFSSDRMDRQIVPEGKTFGWKSGGSNLHAGGLLGYSSVNCITTLYVPPSHAVCRGGEGGEAEGGGDASAAGRGGAAHAASHCARRHLPRAATHPCLPRDAAHPV